MSALEAMIIFLQVISVARNLLISSLMHKLIVLISIVNRGLQAKFPF